MTPTRDSGRNEAAEAMAVRAVLRLLWEALQPYHFWIGFYAGLFALTLSLVLVGLLP